MTPSNDELATSSDTDENGTARPTSQPRILPRLAGAPLIPLSTLSGVGLPVGTAWANWFAFFNALSWPVVLGAPLFLYAKDLGAGDAVLGLLAALPPLMAVLHIPGNHLIPRLGYRGMMIFGWGSRTLAVVAMALIPWILRGQSAALVALIICLFAFSTFRGLAGGAWMPWVASLIPPDIRGRFFLRDQLYAQTGNLLALFLVALIFFSSPGGWQFSLAFLIAAAGGTASVLCLLPLPDISSPEHHTEANSRKSFVQMLSERKFRQLCIFNIAFMLVMGGLAVFTVAYLRGIAKLPQSEIIIYSALAIVGGIISLFWCGTVLDHIGSRPIINWSLLGLILVFLAWWALASGIIPASWPFLSAIYLLSGVAGLNFSAANNRLQSLNIPKLGRNHHFAFLLVLLNVAAAISPIIWGLILECVGSRTWQTAGIHWNRYSLFFGSCAVLMIPVFFLSRALDDRPAQSEVP